MGNTRTYIAIIALVGLGLSAVVATINWFVDPYGLFEAPVRLELVRPEIANHERELKAHRITQHRASGLILGASTSAAGLDPRHPDWGTGNVYNMAVGQGSISNARDFLRHAAEFQMPTQVVLGVELAMFNPNMQAMVGLNADALAVTENGEANPEYATRAYYGKLLSKTMLKSSLTAIIASLDPRARDAAGERPIGDDGLLYSERFELKGWRSWRNHFQLRIIEHLERFWAPIENFKRSEDLYSSAGFEAYRDIIAFACNNDIELYVVITPVHAYLTEAMGFAGLQPVWETWVRGLVEDAENESRKHGCAAVPVWDFSGYNNITTETIYATTKAEDSPRWYWDSAHFKTDMGDQVLARIFGRDAAAAGNGFGARLHTETLATHFEAIRAQRALYAKEHAEEIAVVQTTVRRTLGTAEPK